MRAVPCVVRLDRPHGDARARCCPRGRPCRRGGLRPHIRSTLPIYEHEGRLYVAGEPRHQYELRIRNHPAGRLLAVTSVDGVNVITGETAAQQQSGYVLGAWDSVGSKAGARISTRSPRSTSRASPIPMLREPGAGRCRRHRRRAVSRTSAALRALLSTVREDRAAAPRPHPKRAPRQPTQAELQARLSGARQRRSEEKLGTGHGHREASPAQYVDFERASSTPDETIVIYYDSRKNLVAQGVLPQPHRLVRGSPARIRSPTASCRIPRCT